MKKFMLTFLTALASTSICFGASIKGIVVIASETQAMQILKKGKPIVMLFSTSWCGPCKMIAPTIEQLIEEHPDVIFCYVDGDNGALAGLKAKYGVQAYPTLIFFNKSGKQVGDNMRGAQSKAMMKRAIASISNGSAITPTAKMAAPQRKQMMAKPHEEKVMHEAAPIKKAHPKKMRSSRASMKKIDTYAPEMEYSGSCPVRKR